MQPTECAKIVMLDLKLLCQWNVTQSMAWAKRAREWY